MLFYYFDLDPIPNHIYQHDNCYKQENTPTLYPTPTPTLTPSKLQPTPTHTSTANQNMSNTFIVLYLSCLNYII